MSKFWLQDNFHPFIVYAFLGSFIAYLLVLFMIKRLRIEDPRTRSQLMFLPLIIPAFTYMAARVFEINPRCLLVATNTGSKTIDSMLQGLCTASNALAAIVTPLFFLAFAFAVIKALISLTACKRLVRKYGLATMATQPRVMTMVQHLAAKGGIDLPEVVVTTHAFAQAFTFGFRETVIVISRGLLDNLDDDELETVLAHEMAHIIRKDAFYNWIAVLLRDLMFFAPVTYWVFNYLTDEKEKASDDITLELTDKPLAFAAALIKVWRLSPKSFWANLVWDNFSPNPGLVKKEGILQSRVERVIGRVNNLRQHSVGWVTGGIVTSVMGVLLLVC